MPPSVMRLLDNLEARLDQAHAEMMALRDENQHLRHRLTSAGETSAQEPLAPDAPEKSSATGEAVAGETAIAGETREKTKPEAAAKGPEGSLEERPGKSSEEGSEESLEESRQESMREAGQEDAQTVEVTLETPAHAAAQPEPPSPQVLLEQWYVRYPKAFLAGHTRPLKVGIHEDLARDEPWSNKLIRRALAHYVNLPRYVKALREGAPRIDLNGNPVGEVDATAAKNALEKRQRQTNNRRRSGKERSGTDRVTNRKSEQGSARKPRRPKQSDAGSIKGEPRPQSETLEQPAQSMEDKLASLQRRFGGKD